MKMLRATLPSTIDMQAEIAPENMAVFGDPTQIHQVIMNLGANAGQAMRQHGGVLTMRLEESTLQAGPRAVSVDLPAGPYLVISVGDTGEGIPPDVLSRIFEPYFTTKSPDHGTGLGLAVVHGHCPGSWRSRDRGQQGGPGRNLPHLSARPGRRAQRVAGTAATCGRETASASCLWMTSPPWSIWAGRS